MNNFMKDGYELATGYEQNYDFAVKDLISFAIDIIFVGIGAGIAWFLPKAVDPKLNSGVDGVIASGLATLASRELIYFFTKNDRYKNDVTLGGTAVTGFKALNLIHETLAEENGPGIVLNADEYLLNIIKREIADPIKINDMSLEPITDIVKSCTGANLNELKISGSAARGTATGGADTDIFISEKHGSGSLENIYNDLYVCLDNHQLDPIKKNVAIGIEFNGSEIDLVPARQQNGYKNYHSLYTNREGGSWKQTNIDEHTNKVVNSGRQDEIIATRIWRDNNNLKFPSIYLDFSVIKALENENKGQIADNFKTVLKYLSDEFVYNTIWDPANTNNKISDLLSEEQKQRIARSAAKSLSKNDWRDIIR